jgi:hypothetical protein
MGVAFGAKNSTVPIFSAGELYHDELAANLTNHRALYVQKSLLLGSEVVWSWDGSCVCVAISENTIYKLIRVSWYSQGSALVYSCE